MEYRLVLGKAARIAAGMGKKTAPYAAMALLGLALAWGTWKIIGPAPRVVLPSHTIPPRTSFSSQVAAAHLFGEPQAQQAAAMPEVIVKGVFAEMGTAPGYAILLVDKQTVIASLKKEIRPGIVLEKIAADHVEFSHGGQTVRVPIDAGRPAAAIQTLKK